ncbi:MAG: phosphopantetheine-binding protein [Polyangiaceae bacterium]
MANYDEALKVTTEILVRHAKLDRPITPKDKIQSDLGMDSLAIMEAIADIEDHFHVQIPQEELERLSTVEDVARALVVERPKT